MTAALVQSSNTTAFSMVLPEPSLLPLILLCWKLERHLHRAFEHTHRWNLSVCEPLQVLLGNCNYNAALPVVDP